MQPPGKPDVFLESMDVARLLGVHGSTVRDWASRGLLRPSAVTGRGGRLFELEEVRRFAAARQPAPPRPTATAGESDAV